MEIAGFDYTAGKFWLDVVVLILSVLAAGYAWLRTRHTANANDIKTLRDWADIRINELDSRLTVVERDIEHGPTHAQIAEVHDRLTQVSKDLSEVVGQMKAYNRQVSMINEHLLKR